MTALLRAQQRRAKVRQTLTLRLGLTRTGEAMHNPLSSQQGLCLMQGNSNLWEWFMSALA
ncbi:hypothetical protein [Pseudomonas indica]|uniref:hypothetical protein n=1 Tax=Pseudomonas indica TaxID=137658 RepID=UPI003FD03CCF